jgi:hypothetical protein
MDIEEAIRQHPHFGIPFVLCSLMAVALLFAFVMQWNQYSMIEKQWTGLKVEWKKGARLKTLLRWYFLGDFIAAKRIWGESKGIRFVLPLGFTFGIVAWLLYLVLAHVAA